MNTKQTALAIESRISTRKFLEKPIENSDLEKISSYLNNPKNLIGPFGHKFKFEIVIEKKNQKEQKIGTYGVVRNAQGYIIGCSKADTENLFDYAFVFEKLVLFLTVLGIGTCWLGGRFRKQHAMSNISLTKDEIIPAITPIGYSSNKKHLLEKLMSLKLKPRTRKAESQMFFYKNFDEPLGDRAMEFQQALHYVRIAPSAQNKQPWRLVFSEDLSQVHFYFISSLDSNPLYMCAPEYLDIGIAYTHFKSGLDEAGIKGQLNIKEPSLEKPEGAFYITSWSRES